MDHRQAIFQRDVEQPRQLARCQGVPDAALDAGIVGVDQHFPAADHPQAGDDVGARHFAVVVLAGGQRRELEEGGAGVEQQIEALAHQQLALIAHALDLVRRPPVAGDLHAFAVLRDDGGHRLVIAAVRRGRCVDAGFDAFHRSVLRGLAASR